MASSGVAAEHIRRAAGRTPHLVAVCAPLDAGRHRRLLASGVRDFLRKPLDFAQMLRAIQAIAARAGFNVSAAPPRSRR